jgi:TonB family protein
MGSVHGPVSTELEQARTAPEFGAHTPLSEKLLAVAIRAQNFTGSTGIAIALTEGQEMFCRASWGTSAPEVGTRLSLEHSFTGLCVRSGEPQRCDDAQNDPRVDPEACRELGISAIAAAPVRRGLKVIGVIAAFSDTPNAFTDKHLLILTTLSEVIAELLDDPVQPLPEIVETTPDPVRAAAVAHAPDLPLVDRAAVDTVLQEAPPAQVHPSPIAAEIPEAPVEDAATAEPESPAKPQLAKSEPLPHIKPSATSFAAPTAQFRTMGSAASLDSVAQPISEILPAAMDPGPLPQLNTSTLVPSNKPAEQVSSEPSAADTLTFATLSDSVLRRRWLLPAVVGVVFVVGIAGWRLHVARRGDVEKQAPALVQQVQESAPVPEVAQETRVEAAAPAEPQHSPFIPPPMTAVSKPPKTKPAPVPADVTVRQSPQPVIEAAEPVRRPSSVAQVTEAPAPQLALSAPALPIVVPRPATPAVAAPVSRVFVAQLMRRVEPAYPEAARRLRISGKVIVKATITKAGMVGDVRWVSGNDLFRDATLTAVKQWRYKPASLNGQPVESELEIVLHFNRPTN